MSTFASASETFLKSRQKAALRRLIADIICSVKQYEPLEEETVDALLDEYQDTESLVRFLLQKYWPDVTITPKLLSTFYHFYGLQLEVNEN